MKKRQNLVLVVLASLVVPGSAHFFIGRKLWGTVLFALWAVAVAMEISIFIHKTNVTAPPLGVCVVGFAIIHGAFAAHSWNKSIEADEHRTCPHCAEKILRAAKVCRFCTRDVTAC